MDLTAPPLGTVTPLHWLGVACAVVTGVIHLWLGVAFAGSAMGASFLFAGVVFFVAAGAVVYDVRRRPLYVLGVPFTGVQIVLWYLVNAPNFEPPGVADKVAQVVLIAVCVVLYRREPGE